MPLFFAIMSFSSIWGIFVLTGKESAIFRIAFIKTSVFIGVFIVVFTEVFSAFHVLTSIWLVGLWMALAFSSSVFFIRTFNKQRFLSIIFRLQRIRVSFNHQNLYNKTSICTAGILLFICLLTALLAAPNNSDSLCYHLPRVAHWIQNRSVVHYPTHDLRQISFPPGAAYIQAHLNLLNHGDSAANCVQWWAFLGSVIGLSLMTKSMVGSHAQAAVSLVCASIPMAIMQSTTTQNDLIVTFWLICFVYFIFHSNTYTTEDLIWMAMGLGLAIVTKPTAYIFGFPFLVMLGYKFYAERCTTKSLLSKMAAPAYKLLIILVLAVSLSLPAYARNVHVFGTFLGTDTGTRIKTISPVTVISNILRNIGLNLPSYGYWKAVEAIHHGLFGIKMNEPSSTYEGNSFQYKYRWFYLLPDEDVVGSPTHLILFVVAVVLLFRRGNYNREGEPTDLRWLVICLLTGFVLYSSLLKWQIWGNRLLLPIIFIGSIVSGQMLTQLDAKGFRLVPRIVIFGLAAIGIFYSLTPIRHPFIPIPKSYSTYSQSNSVFSLTRQENYFSGTYKDLNKPIKTICDRIQRDKIKVVGLEFDHQIPEYLLWASLLNRNYFVKIMHIDVNNRSNVLGQEFPDEKLDAIVIFGKDKIEYRRLRKRSSDSI